jgi:hypothetical protein
MNALLTYLSFAATLTLTLVVNYLFIYQPINATLNLLIGKLDAVQAKLETPLVARDEARAQPVPGPLAAQPFPTPLPEPLAAEPDPTPLPSPTIPLEGVSAYQIYTRTAGDDTKPSATVVIFEDPLCPWCRLMTKEILPELLSTYENDLNFTIAHRLVNIIGGSRSLDLIAGAHCAGLIAGNEAFKRYLEAVYDAQSQGGAANSAIQEGQRGEFEACVREKRWEGAFREDNSAQRRFGITGTPTIYINGAVVSGADSDAMRTILDSIKTGRS